MNDTFIPIVDFHSHILPFVDHGSSSFETTKNLLIQAKKAGVATIVATPHFYPHLHTVVDFVRKRDAAYQALTEYLFEKSMTDIPIVLGAEVALEKELTMLSDLSSLAIQGTDHILIEMPLFEKWQSWMFDFLYRIQSEHNLRVILAHVDRYPLEDAEKLLNMGFAAQVNATALVRGKDKRKLRDLCNDGLIQLIGCDVHDEMQRNYNDLLLARRKLNTELFSYFYDNSLDILK